MFTKITNCIKAACLSFTFCFFVWDNVGILFQDFDDMTELKLDIKESKKESEPNFQTYYQLDQLEN